MTIDGKIVRLVNYQDGTGQWETLHLTPTGKEMTSLVLHFGQGSAENNGTETRVTKIGKIWMDNGRDDVIVATETPKEKTAVVPQEVKPALFKSIKPTFAPYVDGDRVATIGDSITHNGSYHAFVVDFYLTRFPKAKIVFYNRGISGDSAGGVLSRWDWDVTTRDFNKATLMLGMNDVNRSLYGVDKPDVAKQQEALSSWKNNMAEILKRLTAKNVGIALITPSIYDQTSTQSRKNDLGVNDALSNCGEVNIALAREKGWGLIDFQGPLYQLNLEVQKTNSAATIIGGDRIHPGDLGHSVMALEYLKAQGLCSKVAEVVIDASASRVEKTEKASAADLKITSSEIKFSLTCESLPVPVTAGYLAADPLVNLTEQINNEPLVVKGLAAGEWALEIDGVELGRYPSASFAFGINIATNAKNPDQVQAQAVHNTNWTRRGLEAQTRNIVMVEMNFPRFKIDPNDPEAVKKFCEDQVETQKKPGGNPYLVGLYGGYLTLKPKQAVLHQQIDDLWQVLWKINQPIAHQVVIKKI
jgi:endoglucanase